MDTGQPAHGGGEKLVIAITKGGLQMRSKVKVVSVTEGLLKFQGKLAATNGQLGLCKLPIKVALFPFCLIPRL